MSLSLALLESWLAIFVEYAHLLQGAKQPQAAKYKKHAKQARVSLSACKHKNYHNRTCNRSNHRDILKFVIIFTNHHHFCYFENVFLECVSFGCFSHILKLACSNMFNCFQPIPHGHNHSLHGR